MSDRQIDAETHEWAWFFVAKWEGLIASYVRPHVLYLRTQTADDLMQVCRLTCYRALVQAEVRAAVFPERAVRGAIRGHLNRLSQSGITGVPRNAEKLDIASIHEVEGNGEEFFELTGKLDATAPVDDADERQKLFRLLAVLTPVERRVLRHLVCDGLQHSDISKLYRRKRGWSRTMMAIAIKKLQAVASNAGLQVADTIHPEKYGRIEFRGETRTRSEVAKLVGVSRETVSDRVSRGLPAEARA